MRRGVALVAGIVVVAFVLAAGVVAMVRRGPDCPVSLPEADALPQLVPADRLAPTGSVGRQRRPTLDALEGLPAPFDGLIAGRFYESPNQVPTLVPSGSGVVLVETRRKTGSFEALTLPGGDPLWAREYRAGAARGGRVADSFVVLVGGPQPALVSFDVATGKQVACLAVPAKPGDAATLLTDQAGRDVVVAAAPLAAPLTLSRIDPSGGVRWHERLDGLVEAGSLTVAGGTVAVGRIGADPARLADMAAAGGIGAPMVRAYSVESGRRTWTYPTAEDAASTAVSVVGAEPSGSGGLVVLAARRGRSGSSTDVRVRLEALRPDGSVRWVTPLGTGYWSAQLVGGLVVAQGADPRGGPMLRAYALDDGRRRWTVRSRKVPLVGYQARRNFGSVSQIGASLVVPSPNGLVSIDPSSGRVTRLDSRVEIEEVLPVGAVAVVRTQDAVFVLRTT